MRLQRLTTATPTFVVAYTHPSTFSLGPASPLCNGFNAYSQVDEHLEIPSTLFRILLRRPYTGFGASIGPNPSYSILVAKTYWQVNETHIGYFDLAKAVVEKDNVKGFPGGGLQTRIIPNGLQGIMFSVHRKLFLAIGYMA